MWWLEAENPVRSCPAKANSQVGKSVIRHGLLTRAEDSATLQLNTGERWHIFFMHVSRVHALNR